ncbi:MAG: hypothetical protein JXR37_04300 [Kiritimatiellae bacterium]|nr:hypothetical protein [Kiritimatiellia bacterium]
MKLHRCALLCCVWLMLASCTTVPDRAREAGPADVYLSASDLTHFEAKARAIIAEFDGMDVNAALLASCTNVYFVMEPDKPEVIHVDFLTYERGSQRVTFDRVSRKFVSRGDLLCLWEQPAPKSAAPSRAGQSGPTADARNEVWQGFVHVEFDGLLVQAMMDAEQHQGPETTGLAQLLRVKKLLEEEYPEYGTLPLYLSADAAAKAAELKMPVFPRDEVVRKEGLLVVPRLQEEYIRDLEARNLGQTFLDVLPLPIHFGGFLQVFAWATQSEVSIEPYGVVFKPREEQ